ncbi:MFS transporter [Pelomonas sp. KK5]|uniref:MFS transporter n=1 Tax=Pelomonas sp. KK5 TaxID=1855730 RepID=UPI00097C621B|nr:MFS transporter [Pelomonas sp. KK5]
MTVRSPWAWVPTLYFSQGIPYVVVMTLSVIMYKNFGVSNADIALYTSWLYLPWVIKPLWSPLVEMIGTKRGWTVVLQFVVGAALALVALTIPGPMVFRMTLAVLWLMAFASASHDIAADGFYMLALPTHQQAAFVGVRSTFYRFANIAGQGALVYLAGTLQERFGDMKWAWSTVFFLLCGLFLAAAVWHQFVLPRPAEDRKAEAGRMTPAEFLRIFKLFFARPGIAVILGFLLLYRFPEAQLLKLATPFLLDQTDAGGLALHTKDVGIAYGTVGLIALTLGGLLGGWIVSRFGLKRVLWPLIFAMHVPNAVFLAMAWFQPGSLWLISAALAVEQFGYGLGFTAYMMYMILVSQGEHKTAHYAICTGFMALGMMLPGMWSGKLQEALGYVNFFGWVLLATIPSFAMAALVRIPEGFGKKEQ